MSLSQTPASRLVLALAQIDCTVGDVAGNGARIRAARARATRARSPATSCYIDGS